MSDTYPSRVVDAEQTRRQYGARVDELLPWLLRDDPIADAVAVLLRGQPSSSKILYRVLEEGRTENETLPPAIDRLIAYIEQVVDISGKSTADRHSATGTTTRGVQVLYISPLKALGVDVERNLRAPLAGVLAVAQRQQLDFHEPTVGVRSGESINWQCFIKKLEGLFESTEVLCASIATALRPAVAAPSRRPSKPRRRQN